MSEPVVLLEKRGRVAVVTFNRPKALNAINPAVLDVLDAVITEIELDPELRVVVLAGAGGRAFVAGADIRAMRHFTVLEAERFAAYGQAVLARLETLSLPVIAAVGGYALGGGCEISMACDMVLAGERAVFGQPEVALGVIPGFGGTQRLVRRIGPSKAMDLVLTARRVRADEAVAMGLASRKVEGDVLEAALAVAEEIMANGPVAVAQAKRAIVENADSSLDAALAAERNLFAMCFASPEQGEGMDAFIEKRKADFPR